MFLEIHPLVRITDNLILSQKSLSRNAYAEACASHRPHKLVVGDALDVSPEAEASGEGLSGGATLTPKLQRRRMAKGSATRGQRRSKDCKALLAEYEDFVKLYLPFADPVRNLFYAFKTTSY